MNIEDIKNKKIKLCPSSITVKDDNGKTQGIVTSIKAFKDLRTADQMVYFKELKKSGILDNTDFLKCFIVHNGKPFYLHNLKAIEIYEEVFSGIDGWEDEKLKYEKRIQIAENATMFATVIPCYIQ